MDILEYGQGIEKALFRMLQQQMGWKVFNQNNENYSQIDGILQGDLLQPIQVKALSPRVFYRDVGFTHSQWKKYKKYSNQYPNFTCYVLTTTYNPTFDLDYRLYEFNIKDVNPTQQDSDFIYIKLDKMEKSKINIPENFQRIIEKAHKEIIRPSIRKDLVGSCKDKF